MTDFLKKNLNQTAVYWANPVEVGDGNLTFDDGEEIDCRWEERQELFLDSTGQERKSEAVVFVAQDLEVGEFLYLGSADDLDSDISDPVTVDSFEVKAFVKVPNIAGTKFERKAYL